MYLCAPIIPFFYLSASFICLSPLSVCSLAAAPAQNSPHGLPSPTVEITYPSQAPIFKHQALPSQNVKSFQSQSHFSFSLCLFQWASHSHPVFFLPCLYFCVHLFLMHMRSLCLIYFLCFFALSVVIFTCSTSAPLCPEVFL